MITSLSYCTRLYPQPSDSCPIQGCLALPYASPDVGWVGEVRTRGSKGNFFLFPPPLPLPLNLRVSPCLCRPGSVFPSVLSLLIPHLPVFSLSSPTRLCLAASVSSPANFPHLSLSLLTPPHSCFSTASALGGHACLVCGRLPGQCQERRHHGQPVRHGDPEGNWHQQPPAQAQATPRHSGDGVAHITLSTRFLPHCELCCWAPSLIVLQTWAH